MIGRGVLLALGGWLLCAAEAPPPPPELAAYIEDGSWNPRDYAWVKGRFDDASEQDRAVFRAIGQWSAHCTQQARVEVLQQLAAAGFPDAKLENSVLGPLLCRQATPPFVPQIGSYAEFAQEVEQVTPIAETFLFGVRLAEASVVKTADLSLALQTRALGEQMLRRAVSWGQGAVSDAPPLTPAGREIVRSRLWAAIMARDDANTAWLKDVVARQGWPRISVVGEPAAVQAWLVVQQADHDPVFQLEALRLMEPLVAVKEVSPQNYAYLYDRVMLKLAGKQRYGSQFHCVDGQYVPQALEDEAAVDRLRSEVGMETQAENTARIRASNGTC